MELHTEFPYVCRTAEEIPDGARLVLRPEVVNALGGTLSEIFPDFARAFPLTATSLERHWPKPVIVCRSDINIWIARVVLDREDSNLFFDLVRASQDIAGEDFDDNRALLPIRWIELYRWFHSFCIIKSPVFSLRWQNTPFTWASRWNLEDYVKEHLKLKSSAVRDVEKKLGIRHEWFKCWLHTNAGDALFIDELTRDKKVYHVRHDDLSDIVVLHDPEETLDRYLAHVVAGGAPKDFNFRERV